MRWPLITTKTSDLFGAVIVNIFTHFILFEKTEGATGSSDETNLQVSVEMCLNNALYRYGTFVDLKETKTQKSSIDALLSVTCHCYHSKFVAMNFCVLDTF